MFKKWRDTRSLKDDVSMLKRINKSLAHTNAGLYADKTILLGCIQRAIDLMEEAKDDEALEALQDALDEVVGWSRGSASASCSCSQYLNGSEVPCTPGRPPN